MNNKKVAKELLKVAKSLVESNAIKTSSKKYNIDNIEYEFSVVSNGTDITFRLLSLVDLKTKKKIPSSKRKSIAIHTFGAIVYDTNKQQEKEYKKEENIANKKLKIFLKDNK